MGTFTLEAMFAKHGDALLLHADDEGRPTCLLIDGGPPGIYGTYLRKRLAQVK